MATPWIDALAAQLAAEPVFGDCALRAATRADEAMLYALHRDGLREYVAATWGWNEHWQQAHFAGHFAPARNAVIVRGSGAADIGRVSLSRHWRGVFLRDIELAATERNRGLGSAIVRAVLALARAEDRPVELFVLNCNPARQLYARLGFRIIGDDGARLMMRAS
ncbi:MAG: GNAT family N-acetyltransferase [Casimicrobiaceae bacterium]